MNMGQQIEMAIGQADAPGWAGFGAIAAGTFVLVTTEFLPIGLLRRLRSSSGGFSSSPAMMSRPSRPWPVSLPTSASLPCLSVRSRKLGARWNSAGRCPALIC